MNVTSTTLFCQPKGNSAEKIQHGPAHQRPNDVEARANAFAENILAHLAARRAQFVRRGTALGVASSQGFVELNYRDDNLNLARLLLESCNVTPSSALGRAVIVRLMVYADEVAKRVKYRSLGAATDSAIYMSATDNRLLAISTDGFAFVDNGTNPDRIWVDRSSSADGICPTVWARSAEDSQIQQALDLFEEGIVHSQGCTERAMSWFVALNGCFIPFVRDWLSARLIVVHTGPPQSGKTTGARRLIRFHGLPDVHGDVTVAALSNGIDPGFLVLDNVEQNDVHRALHNYLLFLATGALRGRSDSDGNVRVQASRPITHLTSIEGSHTDELRRRCVEVEYRLPGPPIATEHIDAVIESHRNELLVATAYVLQQLLRLRCAGAPAKHPVPGAVAGFPGHYNLLCDLLVAYGQIRRRPDEWAAEIIAAWVQTLGRSAESSTSPLEFLIRKVSLHGHLGAAVPTCLEGTAGQLYRTEVGVLLAALYGCTDSRQELPKTPAGLARRLRGSSFVSLRVVDAESAPEIHCLRRTKHSRPIGIFLPDESIETVAPVGPAAWPSVPHLNLIDESHLAQHSYLRSSDRVYFLWEYQPAEQCPVDRFIQAFKARPGSNADRKKDMAIEFAARSLATAIPTELTTRLFVPIPSSGAGEGGEDQRIVRSLNLVMPRLKVSPILAQRFPTASGIKGITVRERAQNLVVRDDLVDDSCKQIVLVDDVIASGCHFKAAVRAIKDRLPNADVVGLVLVRRRIR